MKIPSMSDLLSRRSSINLMGAFVLGLLLLAGNCFAVEPEELRQAGRMIGAFFDGEVAGTQRYFTPELAGRLDAKKLAKMQVSLVERGGGVRYVEIPYLIRESILEDGVTPSVTVGAPVDLEKMTVEVVMVWTGTFGPGMISGFAVRPLSRNKSDLNIRREMYRYTTPAYITEGGFTESQIPIAGSSNTRALPASLCLPVKSVNVTQYPAVVFIPDHAMSDADGTIGPNKIYRDMGQALAEKGIITLRLSPRWVLDPELEKQNYTFRNELVNDVRSAAHYLHQRRDVIPGAVYLVGFDYGGFVSTALCKEKNLMRGVVLLSPQPDYSPATIVEQMEFEGSNLNFTEKEWSIIKGTLSYLKSETLDEGDQFLGRPASYWYSLKEITPFDSLREFKGPALLLFGEFDYYLSEENLNSWVQLAKERRNVDIRVFPKLNRWMIPARDGGSFREKEIPGHVSRTVIELLTNAVLNDSKGTKR